ncbi:MAG: PQQ-dependent sugar dehydrogenase, partial [Robiginitalea sp.]|uniref:PQQ-dependent sugar dehydrogenase n=1 Tax=Robiginitalea sp. TaxID=1902411 RepID=UPI003C7428EF
MKHIGPNLKLLATGICFLAIFSCKESKTPEQNENTAESANTSQAVDEAAAGQGSLPLDRLNLPEGFAISTFAEGVEDARSMAIGDKGTLFVGTRKANKLYAIQDLDGDFRADRTLVLDTTLIVPNGIAFRNGDLYVAEINRLLRYRNIENNLEDLPEPEIIYEDYPTEGHHGWKYIAFGPDDKLYVPVGAPCNICDSAQVDKRYASITRMDPDGSNREVYANGVRNTVGFTWHPETGELWFTDNGRDMMGDDVPPCELNRVSESGQHFGYPFCHGGTIADPEYGDQRPCS